MLCTHNKGAHRRGAWESVALGWATMWLLGAGDWPIFVGQEPWPSLRADPALFWSFQIGPPLCRFMELCLAQASPFLGWAVLLWSLFTLSGSSWFFFSNPLIWVVSQWECYWHCDNEIISPPIFSTHPYFPPPSCFRHRYLISHRSKLRLWAKV